MHKPVSHSQLLSDFLHSFFVVIPSQALSANIGREKEVLSDELKSPPSAINIPFVVTL